MEKKKQKKRQIALARMNSPMEAIQENMKLVVENQAMNTTQFPSRIENNSIDHIRRYTGNGKMKLGQAK